MAGFTQHTVETTRSRTHRVLAWLALTKQLWRLNFSVSGRFAGQTFKIPIVFGEGRQNLARLEPWLLESLARIFALRGGAFLDVGVNLGQTLLKAKALDRERPYYGFEPNPRCCHYVEQLIRANRLPACALIPAGLSDRNGLAVLKWTRNVDVDSSASLVPGFWPDEAQLETRYATVLNGDEAIRNIGIAAVGAIKVDVEGAELDVLRGLRATLSTHRPFVICEILPVVDATSEFGRQRVERQEQLIDLLSTLDYGLFRVDARAEVEPISTIAVHADLELANYIAVPHEERDRFIGTFPLRAAPRVP